MLARDPQYTTTEAAQAQAKAPCILPVVCDGTKASSTHYYLLPERPAYLDKYERFLRDSESSEDRKTTNMATVRPMIQQKPASKPSYSSTTNSSGIANPPILAWTTNQVSINRSESTAPTLNSVKYVSRLPFFFIYSQTKRNL